MNYGTSVQKISAQNMKAEDPTGTETLRHFWKWANLISFPKVRRESEVRISLA